ncbi:hypothetical protein ABXZ88_003237 [Vibrio fluvialis]
MKYKDFVSYPYDTEQARLDDATADLNVWLTQDERVKVVNVESIYSSEGAMMGSTELKFKNLRVWYNVVERGKNHGNSD